MIDEYRMVIPDQPYEIIDIAPSVWVRRLYPGGMAGPGGETHEDFPGGRGWSEVILLGTEEDDFIYAMPDIRLPGNQLWPMHWHDCWTVVVVLEGRCMIADWYMDVGDVFVASPSIEYGPLVMGPNGGRILEIFGDLALSPGGYGEEYRDHVTLRAGPYVFKPREGVNLRNEGHSTLSLEGLDGIWKTRLAPGWQWYFGDKDDPDCPLARDTRLSAGEVVPASPRGDWYAALVLDGEVALGGKTFGRDDMIMAKPGGVVPEIKAGPQGAHLLENFRTLRAL